MPWCEPCSRFFAPPSMNPDGSCPSCGGAIVEPAVEVPKAPWHFKLLVTAVAVYLAWRVIQMLGWIVG